MNGIYLFLALKEIEPVLISKYISRISAKERLIQIELGDSAFFISLFPQALGFYLNRIQPVFERLAYFDDHIAGSRIISIKQIDFMPVFDMNTEKTEYGQKQHCIIRCSFYKEAPNLTVISKEVQKNLYGRYIERKPKHSILDIKSEQNMDGEALITNFEGIDKFLARELNKENLKKLRSILSGAPCKPKIVSSSPLRISLFAPSYIHEYDTYNELFLEGINSFLKEKEEISRQSDKQRLIRKLERRFEQLNRELNDTRSLQFYKIAGELILANIPKIKRGMERVKVFNPYAQQEIEINLDPAKGPRENAEDYFKRYKKLKRGIPKRQEQIRKLKVQIESLKSSVDFEKDTRGKSTVPGREKKVSLPFREFVLDSGSKVYVGKNAKSNMELTFRFARPEDYFFHIRGCEGAHTILRPVMQKGQNIKKDDIEKAASIAAYFSKAKTQKKVPVSYTQRKYLKKSKKGKLGTVILMRESVVFVDPGLPSDTED